MEGRTIAFWKYTLEFNGTEVELQQGETSLGRSRNCTLPLRDASASRRHAILEVEGVIARLRDLGSSNGTYVNGRKVDGAMELSDGDEMIIGETELIFRAKSPVEDVGATIRLDAQSEKTVKVATTGAPPPVGSTRIEPPAPAPPIPPARPSMAPPPLPQAPLGPSKVSKTEIYKDEVMEAARASEVNMPSPASLDESILGSIDRVALSGSPQAAPVPPPVAAVPPLAQSPTVMGNPPGFWVRFLAYLIDAFIVGFVSFVLGKVAFMISPSLASIVSVFTMLGGLAYYFVGWTKFGTTIGKKVFNLWVGTPDGRIGLDTKQAILRIVGYVVSMVIFGLGFVLIAFNPEKKGLHDIIAGTRVHRR